VSGTGAARPAPPLEPFDPRVPAFVDDPYPLYARYRAAEPVHWSPHPSFPELPGCWYVFAYDGVAAVMRDRRAGRSRPPGAPEPPDTPLRRVQRTWMVMHDPPEHGRLRAPVARAFAPRTVEALRPRIANAAVRLADAAREAGGMEAMAAYARPLPDLAIAALLGMPREDLPLLEHWSPDIVRSVDKLTTRDDQARGMAAAGEFAAYLRELLSARRRAPSDDLLSTLATAAPGEALLTDEEVVGACFLLLIAGHETTSNLIGNGLLALLQNPDQLHRLRHEPGRIAGAVEELTRFDGTAQMVSRVAHEAMEVEGRGIAAGDGIVCVLGSANRDPAHFPDPDRLDVTRADVRHLGLGHGLHYCVGAALGRLTAREAFGALLAACPRLELAGAPQRRPDIVMRGLRTLPVAT
jgi:cytochrome P450